MYAIHSFILHAVRHEAASVLRLSPLPPQSIFQLYNFSTGGEGQGEGEFYICPSASCRNKPVSPLIRPSATFSPDLGREGTWERLPLMASILNAHGIKTLKLTFPQPDPPILTKPPTILQHQWPINLNFRPRCCSGIPETDDELFRFGKNAAVLH